MDKQSINNLLMDGEGQLSNEQRLRRWKARWRLTTGYKPVEIYQVGFCRTCSKPHWLINSLQRNITAYCQGH